MAGPTEKPEQPDGIPGPPQIKWDRWHRWPLFTAAEAEQLWKVMSTLRRSRDKSLKRHWFEILVAASRAEASRHFHELGQEVWTENGLRPLPRVRLTKREREDLRELENMLVKVQRDSNQRPDVIARGGRPRATAIDEYVRALCRIYEKITGRRLGVSRLRRGSKLGGPGLAFLRAALTPEVFWPAPPAKRPERRCPYSDEALVQILRRASRGR